MNISNVGFYLFLIIVVGLILLAMMPEEDDQPLVIQHDEQPEHISYISKTDSIPHGWHAVDGEQP